MCLDGRRRNLSASGEKGDAVTHAVAWARPMLDSGESPVTEPDERKRGQHRKEPIGN